VGGGHSSSGGVGADHSSLPQQRLLAERKWRLGLHVRGHPSALMAELYRVLQVGRVLSVHIGCCSCCCRMALLLSIRGYIKLVESQQLLCYMLCIRLC